jgi:hypothetical protein
MPLDIFNVYDTTEVITSNGLENYIEQLKKDRVKDKISLEQNQDIMKVMACLQ